MVSVVKTLKFDKNESCSQGMSHPVYRVIKYAEELKPGEGLIIMVNDYDWAMVIRNIASVKGLGVRDEGKEEDFIKVLVYRD
jgi:TusA-related sulfurtransferase